jgi:hypothetical protein
MYKDSFTLLSLLPQSLLPFGPFIPPLVAIALPIPPPIFFTFEQFVTDLDQSSKFKNLIIC